MIRKITSDGVVSTSASSGADTCNTATFTAPVSLTLLDKLTSSIN